MASVGSAQDAPSRVLVTGATGFVGAALVDELQRRGALVTCLVRPSSDTRALAESGARVVTASLPGPDPALPALVAGHDVVYHVAGATKALDYEAFVRANAVVTDELCAACLAARPAPRRLVLMSSLGAVGPAAPGAILTEAQEPRPVTDYGRSKLEGERRALAYADRMTVVIVRPTGIYGPRDRALLPLLRLARRGIVPVMGRRDQVVNLSHVDDVVQATLLAGTRPVGSGEVFHVGDVLGYSLEEVGGILCGLFGRRARFLPVPRAVLWTAALGAEVGMRLTGRPVLFGRQKLPELRASWVLDVSRARERLGYEPRWALAAGLAATVSWYQARGWLPAPGGAAEGTP
jgi:dihydroflavonol-4-reductase